MVRCSISGASVLEVGEEYSLPLNNGVKLSEETSPTPWIPVDPRTAFADFFKAFCN